MDVPKPAPSYTRLSTVIVLYFQMELCGLGDVGIVLHLRARAWEKEQTAS